MYKWPNRCSQLRYRASAIPTTGTLAPVRDSSAVSKDFPLLNVKFASDKKESDTKLGCVEN
jgi:hypothetical protein